MKLAALLGHKLVRSVDECKNWSDASDIGVGASKFLLSREPIVELTDGTLVLAAYLCSATHPERCYMIRSWDKGYVWTDRALVAGAKWSEPSIYREPNYNEMAVVEVGSNHLIGLLRTDSSYFTNDENDFIPVGGVGRLRLVQSFNNGFSWTQPMETDDIWSTCISFKNQ